MAQQWGVRLFVYVNTPPSLTCFEDMNDSANKGLKGTVERGIYFHILGHGVDDR